MQSASGTNGFAGAADTVLILSRPRGESEGILATTGRDVQEAEYRLQALPHGGWKLSGGSLETAASAQANATTTDSLGEFAAEHSSFSSTNTLKV